MSPSNTRAQSRPRAQSRSRSNTNSAPARRPFFASLFCLPRMPPVFNIVRVCVYVAVLVWTIVCLAIAAHFLSILQASDLTRFVPFAIFVCCASLLIIIALLAFGLWKERNPISTRVELGCLGLTGTLWLALGAFVASSDSEMADVECFSSSAADAEPIDLPGFNTETYHAQYHVLEAFSFFNMILIFGFLALLLVLALRQHRQGTKHVWVLPVTMISWFGPSGRHVPKLPAPVTHRSRSQSRRPTMTEKEKPRARSQSRPADVRRNESQRALLRDDSYRTTDSRRPLNRDDSYRTTDSRRPLNRDDSYRTADSRPRDLRRDDSRRTNDSSRRPDVRRDDSRRTNPGADVRRDDSRRANAAPGESRRLGHQRGSSPTRNEAPTYVYWIPHKSPEEAHTRETRRAAPARDSKFFGLSSRR
ncbi:hypothetical protein L226DRAFT_549767 [Lentinus tigrinus ALCF2SS1-7]|uniref:MARVEL domain-containing protein n=1 Tax=Lentinus tigrinus ALCF2SS1-6 TaxID=1328759 RepID=A0A5C2SVN7_9APHY|nr:hypothetical protein L227DRAFT_648244 [Lentinus tigrinus ALCF2SS1-6]RPD81070.1 hypothetical protein L226DRAFT_549767 [Lentinus tigrinus ALCF2SS1-7]